MGQMRFLPSPLSCAFFLFWICCDSRAFVLSPKRKLSFTTNNHPLWKATAREPSVDDFFDEYFADRVAKDVYRSLDVPFGVPSPVVTYLMEQAVKNLSTDLSRDTKIKLQEMMEAQATPSKYDDFSKEERDELADLIAQEINPKINVPVLEEDQEYILLQQILRVILQSMCTQRKANTAKTLMKWTTQNISASRELLGGPEARMRLAQSIDRQMLQIPLPLDETQRLALIVQAVDSSADMLTRLLPPDLLDTLKEESPDGLLRMKEYLIDAVSAKVDIIGLDESQERKLISTMIHALLDEYVDGTDVEFLLLAPDEQRARLVERKAILQRQKDFSQRRFAREQASLDRQMDRMDQRMAQIPFPTRPSNFLARWRRKGKTRS